jgi:WD40 repeat protein
LLWHRHNVEEGRMRRLQQRVRQTVQAVAFAPDGRTLASGGNDRLVYLWEQATGKELARLSGHKGAVLCLAFSPDGRLLVSGSHDRTTLVWDTRTGKLLQTLRWDVAGRPVALAFTPDGRTLAVAAGSRLQRATGSVRFYKVTGKKGGVPTLRPTGRYSWDAGCQGLEYLPDGTALVLATEGVEMRSWNRHYGVPVGVPTGTFRQKTCRSVSVAPDSKTIAAAEGNAINLWDVETQTKRATLQGHAGVVWSVDFSPDGALLLSGGKDKTVRFWNPATGQEIAAFDWDVGSIQQVAFAPDGMTAAAAGHTGTVVLCDVDAAEMLARPIAPPAPSTKPKFTEGAVRVQSQAGTILGVAFSPDGRLLAEVADGRFSVALRKRNGRLHGTLPPKGSTERLRSGPHLAFTADGRTLAVTAGSRRRVAELPLSLLDVSTGEVRARFALGYSDRSLVNIVGLAFTPEGDHLIAGRKDFPERTKKTGIHLRQGRQGPFRVTLLEHHGSGLSAVALSPDGTTVACATGKGRIVLWDVAAETKRRCPLGAQGACTSLAYAPDNQTLAGALGEKVLLLDTQSGTVRKLTGHESRVTAVAFSPDGTRLLSAATDEVRLWDVASATQRARYEWPFGGTVYCVAFAPDGKGAAAGGRGGVVLWEIGGRA